jgi:hypothetical protein
MVENHAMTALTHQSYCNVWRLVRIDPTPPNFLK